MTITDIAEAARDLSSLLTTVAAVIGGVWFFYIKARRFARGFLDKQDELLQGQQGTNDHLAKLNGSVARHEKEFGLVKERLAAIEGAVFKRPPLPEDL